MRVQSSYRAAKRNLARKNKALRYWNEQSAVQLREAIERAGSRLQLGTFVVKYPG